MPITLNGTTGVVTPGATVGSITGILKASSGVVSQAVAGSDYGQLTLATAQTASGTAVDFTGIPSWVKRITVIFDSLSTNGTSIKLVQLGVSGSPQTTGYAGSYDDYTVTPGVQSITQAGFPFISSANAANASRGSFTLVLLGNNVWAISSVVSSTPARFSLCSGTVTLTGALNMIRFTTVNGTDTFDAGTINISYE